MKLYRALQNFSCNGANCEKGKVLFQNQVIMIGDDRLALLVKDGFLDMQEIADESIPEPVKKDKGKMKKWLTALAHKFKRNSKK